jgi:hypothetical protein
MRKVEFDRIQRSGRVCVIHAVKGIYMNRIIMIQIVAAIFSISGRGQGFLNLNFASAQNLPGYPTNNVQSIPVTNALPHWSAYNGPVNSDNVLADINYLTNSAYAGGTVELLGGSAALSGNDFSVYLGSDAAISQTATVPDDAASLQFEATRPQDGLYVTLDGQNLSYSLLSEGSGYNVYGANIPADLDGQTETLIFGMQNIGNTLLDNIAFSTMSVPEPSECAMMGLGSTIALLVLRRRR